MIDTFTDRRFREPEVLNVRFVREEGRARAWIHPRRTTERNAMTALKRAQRCATVAFRCVDANARDAWGERWGHGGRRNAREISLGNAQKIH